MLGSVDDEAAAKRVDVRLARASCAVAALIFVTLLLAHLLVWWSLEAGLSSAAVETKLWEVCVKQPGAGSSCESYWTGSCAADASGDSSSCSSMKAVRGLLMAPLIAYPLLALAHLILAHVYARTPLAFLGLSACLSSLLAVALLLGILASLRVKAFEDNEAMQRGPAMFCAVAALFVAVTFAIMDCSAQQRRNKQTAREAQVNVPSSLQTHMHQQQQQQQQHQYQPQLQHQTQLLHQQHHHQQQYQKQQPQPHQIMNRQETPSELQNNKGFLEFQKRNQRSEMSVISTQGEKPPSEKQLRQFYEFQQLQRDQFLEQQKAEQQPNQDQNFTQQPESSPPLKMTKKQQKQLAREQVFQNYQPHPFLAEREQRIQMEQQQHEQQQTNPLVYQNNVQNVPPSYDDIENQEQGGEALPRYEDQQRQGYGEL